MNKTFLLLIALVSITNWSAAQTNDEKALRKKIIKGIADYRTELINNTYANIEEYARISFAATGNDIEKTVNKIKNLSFKKLHDDNPYRNVYTEIRKYESGKKSIFSSYSAIEMKIVKENIDLFGLVYQGVLKHDFPYGINSETSFIDEVVFIGIQDGDRIADIGAGSGEVGLLWAIIFKNLEVYMTDIGNIQVDLMRFKSKNIESIDTSNVVKILKGKKKSTMLEGKNLDKIVLKQAFHHFKKKDAMLASIKKSMTRDGELILIETEPTFYKNVRVGCRERLPQSEIESILKKNGFTLIDSERDEHDFYLKFKIEH